MSKCYFQYWSRQILLAHRIYLIVLMMCYSVFHHAALPAASPGFRSRVPETSSSVSGQLQDSVSGSNYDDNWHHVNNYGGVAKSSYAEPLVVVPTQENSALGLRDARSISSEDDGTATEDNNHAISSHFAVDSGNNIASDRRSFDLKEGGTKKASRKRVNNAQSKITIYGANSSKKDVVTAANFQTSDYNGTTPQANEHILTTPGNSQMNREMNNTTQVVSMMTVNGSEAEVSMTDTEYKQFQGTAKHRMQLMMNLFNNLDVLANQMLGLKLASLNSVANYPTNNYAALYDNIGSSSQYQRTNRPYQPFYGIGGGYWPQWQQGGSTGTPAMDNNSMQQLFNGANLAQNMNTRIADVPPLLFQPFSYSLQPPRNSAAAPLPFFNAPPDYDTFGL